MKEFSLEEYLKNPDREVVTRDGRKVRIICTDRKGATPIIALVHNADDGQELATRFIQTASISLIRMMNLTSSLLQQSTRTT